MRFNLRELLAFVAITALACGAFVKGGELMEMVFFSLTLGIVLAAVLLAIGRTAPARMFWIGFAISTGSYLSFAHLADRIENVP